MTSQSQDELRGFLEKVLPAVPGQAVTREPFRRWALELSRYSVETGQKVFGYLKVTATN